MRERISLTLPVINNAGSIFFIAAGDDKAGVIREIIEDNSALPAAMVRPEGGKLLFLLDEGAASLLSR
jgi:6-phosphogluconolactonase